MNTPRILATFALSINHGFNPTGYDYIRRFDEMAPDGLADREGSHLVRCNGRPGILEVPTSGTYERELVLVDWRNGTSDPLREDEEEDEILTLLEHKVRPATGEEALALAWSKVKLENREHAICVARGSLFRTLNGHKYVAPVWNGKRWKLSCWGVWRHETSDRYWLGTKI